MQKKQTQLPTITLVGLTTRTRNKDEMHPETSKIGKLAGSYWERQIAEGIRHRATPGVTYAAYTHFESDEHGYYTYLIGEAVDSLQDQDLAQFETITIPAGSYQQFTTDPGTLPERVIEAWQAIWRMQPSDLGGQRQYVADFEIYDARAANPHNAVIDIYVGVAPVA